MLMKNLTVCVWVLVMKFTDGVYKHQDLFEDNEGSSTHQRLKRQIDGRNQWRPFHNLNNNYENHEQMGVYNRHLNTASLQTQGDLLSGNSLHGNNLYRGIISHDKGRVYSVNNNYSKSRPEKDYIVNTGKFSSQNTIISRDNPYVVSKNTLTEKTAKDSSNLNATDKVNNWKMNLTSSKNNSMFRQAQPINRIFPSQKQTTLVSNSQTPSMNKESANQQTIQKAISRQWSSNIRESQFNSNYRSGRNRVSNISKSTTMGNIANPPSKVDVLSVNGSPKTVSSHLQGIQKNNGVWYPQGHDKHTNTIFGNSKVSQIQGKLRTQVYNQESRPNFTRYNFESIDIANQKFGIMNAKFYDKVPFSQKTEMDWKLPQNKKMYQSMTDNSNVHYGDFNPRAQSSQYLSKNVKKQLPSDFGFHNIRSDRMPPSRRNIVNWQSSMVDNHGGQSIQKQYNNRIPLRMSFKNSGIQTKPYSTTGFRPYSISTFSSAPQPRNNFANIGAKVLLNTNHQTIKKSPNGLLRSGFYYPKTTSESEMKNVRFYPGAKYIKMTSGVTSKTGSVSPDVSSVTNIKHLKFSNDLDVRKYEDKHKSYVTGYGVSEISGTNINGEWYGLLQSIGYYTTSAKPDTSFNLGPNTWQLQSDKSKSYMPRVLKQTTPATYFEGNYQKFVSPIRRSLPQYSNYRMPLSSRPFAKPGVHKHYSLGGNRYATSTSSANKRRMLTSLGSYRNYNKDNKNMFLRKNVYQHNSQDRAINNISGSNLKSLGMGPTLGYIGSNQNLLRDQENIEPQSAGLLDLYYTMNRSFNSFFLSMSRTFNRALHNIFFS